MKMNYPNFVTKMMKNYPHFVTSHHLQVGDLMNHYLQVEVPMPLVEVPMLPEVEAVHL
jgi:hypothetical protein